MNGDKPFVCENCIECCANVVVSPKEIVQIRRYVRSMPAELIDRLRSQDREPGVCPFADVEAKRCTIYEVRPFLCRRFGFVERMQCSYNTHVPLQPFHEGMLELKEEHNLDLKSSRFEDLDILGITVTWEKGLIRK